MATYYVWSGATGAANGTSWTDAWTSIFSLSLAAGDLVLVASDHNENFGATTKYMTYSGAVGNPIKFVSVNRTDDSYLAGAVVQTTSGTATLNITGNHYCRGLKFQINGGVFANSKINISVNVHASPTYDDCEITNTHTGSAAHIIIGSNANSTQGQLNLRNTRLQTVREVQVIGALRMFGGVLKTQASGGIYVGSANEGHHVEIDGVDMSENASSFDPVDASMGQNGIIVIRNCKMPSGWTGSLTTAAPNTVMSHVHMYNCDDGASNYRSEVATYAGYVTSHAGVYRSGGASDGTNNLSLKLTSVTGRTDAFGNSVSTDQISIWNETLTSLTVTVHIAHNEASALNDDEVWIEVMYHGDASSPIKTLVSDRVASPLVTPAVQPTSTETWTGLTTPTKQKLEVTFTPAMVGFIDVRVHLAGDHAADVYVCPKIEVS